MPPYLHPPCCLLTTSLHTSSPPPVFLQDFPSQHPNPSASRTFNSSSLLSALPGPLTRPSPPMVAGKATEDGDAVRRISLMLRPSGGQSETTRSDLRDFFDSDVTSRVHLRAFGSSCSTYYSFLSLIRVNLFSVSYRCSFKDTFEPISFHSLSQT